MTIFTFELRQVKRHHIVWKDSDAIRLYIRTISLLESLLFVRGHFASLRNLNTEKIKSLISLMV